MDTKASCWRLGVRARHLVLVLLRSTLVDLFEDLQASLDSFYCQMKGFTILPDHIRESMISLVSSISRSPYVSVTILAISHHQSIVPQTAIHCTFAIRACKNLLHNHVMQAPFVHIVFRRSRLLPNFPLYDLYRHHCLGARLQDPFNPGYQVSLEDFILGEPWENPIRSQRAAM